MNTILADTTPAPSTFLEEMQNFGVANWILIALSIFVVIMLMVLVGVNMKIMKKYRKEMRSTRAARVTARIEIIDGWCTVVVENKGQEVATNVKLKAKGSIMKYYSAYINRCRVDNVFDKVFGKKFMLLAGDRKQVRLFPIKFVNNAGSLMTNRATVTTADGDVNLIGKTEFSDELEVTEAVDSTDNEILARFGKKEAKLAKKKAKMDAAYRKEQEKLAMAEQTAQRKANKKRGLDTHTSVVEQPDMRALIKKANIAFNVEYESLGYLMKYDYKFKDIDIRDYPEELASAKSIMAAQNALLEQIVILQESIKNLVGDAVARKE